MNAFKHLAMLPGPPDEQAWLKERLETLSAHEEVILTAVLQEKPPGSRADVINRLFSLAKYEVFRRYRPGGLQGPSVGRHQICDVPKRERLYCAKRPRVCL